LIDVAVIGSGHNALVAACHLARAGLEIEVLERDHVIGGAVSTVERFPGHRVDRGSSLHVMVRHTDLVEDLELGECGLRYLDADPWGYAPSERPDMPGILFRTDLEATATSIATVCGRADAAAYRALMGDLLPAAQQLMAMFTHAPTVTGIARRARELTRSHGILETTRRFLQPADHLLDATFDSEPLKAALAWLASQSGPPPHAPATAGHLMWVALMHLRPPGRPVGGSGMLSAALAERLRRFGGRINPDEEVTDLVVEGGRTCGVRTATGREIRARAVLSGAHVLNTLDLLAGAGHEPRGARSRIRVGDGIGAAVRLATTAAPAYPDAPPEALIGMQLLVCDRRRLRAAYAAAITDEPTEHPAALVMTPTSLDSSLAPPGEHSVTIWTQWCRYDPDEVRNRRLREHVARTAIGQVEARAPGFAETVRAVFVQTPLDLERELGLRRGNVMHVEMAPDVMFGLRPLPELSRYRGPLPGLYLTGASTHPGGGVFGASGRNAARTVLRDLRRRDPRHG